MQVQIRPHRTRLGSSSSMGKGRPLYEQIWHNYNSMLRRGGVGGDHSDFSSTALLGKIADVEFWRGLLSPTTYIVVLPADANGGAHTGDFALRLHLVWWESVAKPGKEVPQDRIKSHAPVNAKLILNAIQDTSMRRKATP